MFRNSFDGFLKKFKISCVAAQLAQRNNLSSDWAIVVVVVVVVNLMPRQLIRDLA